MILKSETPYERVMRQAEEEKERWRETEEIARHFNFALTKINSRRYGILKLGGISTVDGVPVVQWDMYEDNHNWETAHKRLRELNHFDLPKERKNGTE